MASETPCGIDGCENWARRGGLCWGHLKRRSRGLPLHQPLAERSTLWSRLVRAALRYADAPADDECEYVRAKDQLRKSAYDYTALRLENQRQRQRRRRR